MTQQGDGNVLPSRGLNYLILSGATGLLTLILTTVIKKSTELAVENAVAATSRKASGTSPSQQEPRQSRPLSQAPRVDIFSLPLPPQDEEPKKEPQSPPKSGMEVRKERKAAEREPTPFKPPQPPPPEKTSPQTQPPKQDWSGEQKSSVQIEYDLAEPEYRLTRALRRRAESEQPSRKAKEKTPLPPKPALPRAQRTRSPHAAQARRTVPMPRVFPTVAYRPSPASKILLSRPHRAR